MNNKGNCILFLSWKDITHPSAGGAELVTDTLAQHLSKTHEVTYFTSTYPGAEAIGSMHGYTVIRRGSVYTTYIHAFIWWHTHASSKRWEYIIDQVHGFPFFSVLYVRHPRIITLAMEVAGDLWSNTPSRMIRRTGTILERAWLRLYRKHRIVTISESTKQDLISGGIAPENISIIPMFSTIHCTKIPEKDAVPTLLSIGRIAPVKRITDAIDTYNIARKTIPTLRLVIIGKTEEAYASYEASVMQRIANDPNITIIKNASDEEKRTWLERSHLLLMTSQKEGYGLVILEAAACGTPSIGYRVPGIQDAIIDKEIGIVVHSNTPAALAASIGEILSDTARYTDMQRAAFNHANSLSAEGTSDAFARSINM